MKKLIALLLLLSLALACLCSCGDGEMVPDGYQAAHDEDACKYKLYVPEAWHVKQDSVSSFTSATVGANDTCNVSVALLPFTSAKSMEEYWDELTAEYKTYFGENITFAQTGTDEETGEPIYWERVSIADTQGFRYVFTQTFGKVEYKIMQIVFFDAGVFSSDMYAFTYTATADHYDTHLEEIQNILKLFAFD